MYSAPSAGNQLSLDNLNQYDVDHIIPYSISQDDSMDNKVLVKKIENQNKGNRKYFSVGAGFKMNVFSLDAAYLISTAQSNPLDQTLRFSLSFDMDGIKDIFGKR